MSKITRFVRSPGVVIVRNDGVDFAMIIRTKFGPKEKVTTLKPYRSLPIEGDATLRLQIAKGAAGSYDEVLKDVTDSIEAFNRRQQESKKAAVAAKKVPAKKAAPVKAARKKS